MAKRSLLLQRGSHPRQAQIRVIDHMHSFEDEIGSKRLEILEKYQVDPLGNITRVHREKRHGI